MSDSFDFKQFSIIQDRCAMKVGTDGVLLGAWTDLENNSRNYRVLDIGAGTGLIALMIAQRVSDKSNKVFSIDAIEIDTDAAIQAEENFNQSRWCNSIHIINNSLQQFAQDLHSDKKYDCIVSNPPFYNATLKPEDDARAVARHKDSLPLFEITDFAQKHLTDEGTLSLIYPTDYDTEVTTAAILSGLHLIRICDVITKKNKPCKRRMATWTLASHPLKEICRETLYIRDENGQYTSQYKNLVKDFYIRLN